MSTENDSASILSDFVLSLDNLPSEMEHLMSEIRSKEQTIQELRNKAEQREIGIAKYHKANGLLSVNPKELPTVQKLRSEYQKIQQLSDDKVRLAERAVAILSRHCGRFEKELGKVQGGSLAMMNPAPAPTPPVMQAAPASPYASIHSPSLAASTSSVAGFIPSYTASSTDRSLKRKNAPSSISTPTPTPLLPGPPTALISPLPTPTLPVLTPVQQASRPNRPSRLSTSFVGGASSPPVSDGESRASAEQPRPLKRQKRRPKGRQMTPDDDEDAEGEEDDGEDASFENGDYSGQTADDKTLYCYCQRVSYGQMVGCDNPNCNYEWFHFECAGLKTQPEGAWYCRECQELMSTQGGGRRRNR